MGPQPVMEPQFLGRSTRSLISTLAPSISYRLEAWPLKILYCPHFLYGSAQFVGQTINPQCMCIALHQEQLTVVLRSHCYTALSLPHEGPVDVSSRPVLPAVVSRVFPRREFS